MILVGLGLAVLVESFFRWSETARAGDRALAAQCLARGYLSGDRPEAERQSLYLAMTYLLDDPSPQVRQALADALAGAAGAPRPLLLALAQDLPEIASRVLLMGPVLDDRDLVDLAGRGASHTRALIAARPNLSAAVAAALAEIGDVCETMILLENPSARLFPFSLLRLAERHGHHEGVRGALLLRDDLPALARHGLVRRATEALASSGLMRSVLGEGRSKRISLEIGNAAAAVIAGDVAIQDIPDLVEQMRDQGLLTPAFLMELLCRGKADVFAGAIEVLSGVQESRVRSILATGRMHAARALLEAAGLDRSLSPLFIEAVFLWREAVQTTGEGEIAAICPRLLSRAEALATTPDAERLIDLVQSLLMEDRRREARRFASRAMVEAA